MTPACAGRGSRRYKKKIKNIVVLRIVFLVSWWLILKNKTNRIKRIKQNHFVTESLRKKYFIVLRIVFLVSWCLSG